MLEGPWWLAARQAFNPFASGRKRAASLELAAEIIQPDMDKDQFIQAFKNALARESKGEIAGTLTDSRGLRTKTLSRAQEYQIVMQDEVMQDEVMQGVNRNNMLAESAWEYLVKAKIATANKVVAQNPKELCEQAARRQRVAEGGKEAIKLGLWIAAAVVGTVFTAGGLPALGAFAALTVFAVQGVLIAAGVATVTPHRLIPPFLRPLFPRLTSIGKGARALAEITINPNPDKRGILAKGVMRVLEIGGNKLHIETKKTKKTERSQQKSQTQKGNDRHGVNETEPTPSMHGKEARIQADLVQKLRSSEPSKLPELLNSVENVNAKTQTDSVFTLLQWAAWDGNLEMAKILVEKGADVNVQDVYKLTPLHLAVQKGHKIWFNFFFSMERILIL